MDFFMDPMHPDESNAAVASTKMATPRDKPGCDAEAPAPAEPSEEELGWWRLHGTVRNEVERSARERMFKNAISMLDELLVNSPTK